MEVIVDFPNQFDSQVKLFAAIELCVLLELFEDQ